MYKLRKRKAAYVAGPAGSTSRSMDRMPCEEDLRAPGQALAREVAKGSVTLLPASISHLTYHILSVPSAT